ncbi:acyl-CoA N-acyltransferase, partial [Pisolithus albus]
MLNIRPANPKDIINLQRCNQLCLPENYVAQFWIHCIVSWPNTSFLAEDASGRVVGYVLASVEPVDDHPHLLVGHINSLAVIRPYRRLGLAKRLMDISKESMTSMHYIQYIQLNVRISNRAALALYRDVLGYTIYRVEHNYYADGEDAFCMRLWI